ncbi:MAG: PAS domain-containing protein [Gammaproteobacteria bacterium]|nr:PAS domain-containing protein [Gammaproteobacteria bacterium]
MMRFLPVGMFRTDIAGNLSFSNPAFQALTGLDGNSTQGWREVVAPGDRGRVDEAWDAFLRGGAVFEQEFRVAPGGTLRWISVRVTTEYQHGSVTWLVSAQ